MRTVVLLCRLGDRPCALPLSHVVETMAPLPVREMPEHPEMPSFIVGSCLVRGETLPVIQGAALLGQAAQQPTRFVTIEREAHRLVLAVQAVIDMRAMPSGPLAAMTSLLSAGQTRLLHLDGLGECLRVLDAVKLLPRANHSIARSKRPWPEHRTADQRRLWAARSA